VGNNGTKNIRCAECEYARPDKKASTYTRKHCKVCDRRDACELCRGCQERDNCKARKNPKLTQSCARRVDTVCPKQTLTWTAYQCTNSDSEYHRALLNVTVHGGMQTEITWCGCAEGERRYVR
jgi:hypothetical protein